MEMEKGRFINATRIAALASRCLPQCATFAEMMLISLHQCALKHSFLGEGAEVALKTDFKSEQKVFIGVRDPRKCKIRTRERSPIHGSQHSPCAQLSVAAS